MVLGLGSLCKGTLSPFSPYAHALHHHQTAPPTSTPPPHASPAPSRAKQTQEEQQVDERGADVHAQDGTDGTTSSASARFDEAQREQEEVMAHASGSFKGTVSYLLHVLPTRALAPGADLQPLISQLDFNYFYASAVTAPAAAGHTGGRTTRP
jgi:hypothetical protein